MKHLAIFAESPPANFVEWWIAHTGCPDVFAQHVAWRAVKCLLNEVNAKAEASMLVNGAEVHQAHGVALLRMLQTFHSAQVSNGVVNKPVNNSVITTVNILPLSQPLTMGELGA